MAIDGFDFTTISDGRVDPDSPLDTTLATDWRDNIEFLMRWLGKSFLVAAVADHDHDGVNSATIDAADLTGTAIVNAFVWVDDGTQVFTQAGGEGLRSISSQVPVGTVNAQIFMEGTADSGGGNRSVAFRVPSTGVFRIMHLSSGFSAAVTTSSVAIIPVNSSRQIDIDYASTEGANGEVRGYQL